MALKQAVGGSELIISPKGVLYHINISRDMGLPRRVLLVGDPNRTREVAKFFDNNGEILGREENREYVSMWGKYKGKEVAVMGTGIGTDNTEIAVVELHAVVEFDYRKKSWQQPDELPILIRVGTSASPQEKFSLGALAISTHAIGLDNTGLYYLHRPVEEYLDEREMLYDPKNITSRAIQSSAQKMFPNRLINPYVSAANREVIKVLREAASELVKSGACTGFDVGITTSAPGFYAPQGRRVGRLGNILVPDLQEKLVEMGVISVGEEEMMPFNKIAVRPTNNEMESSLLFRLGEILGYKVGSVCPVVANRSKGEFITPDGYSAAVDAAILTGLNAIVRLD